MGYPNLPNICDCDVSDKEALASFRACRKRWHFWVLGNDPHSINQQLIEILWDDTVFRMVNEARRICSSLNNNKLGHNLDMLTLFDKGFISSQLMAIRKITDPGNYDPNKAVISLSWVLKDILENNHLLTRENYVCYDGMSYNVTHNEDSTVTFFRERKNLIFDNLSDTQKNNRNRNDLVQKPYIESTLNLLDISQDFRVYANKFLAHASAPSEKRERINKEKNITLEALDKVYRAIVEAASFISLKILFECELGQVPTPQYDQTEGLDKALLKTSDLKNIHEFWSKRIEEVESWSNKSS